VHFSTRTSLSTTTPLHTTIMSFMTNMPGVEGLSFPNRRIKSVTKPDPSNRDSFASALTLINVPEPIEETTDSDSASTQAAVSRITTSTTSTTATTSKRIRFKEFIKRVGTGMLESLA
jgi:hypothetical protein